jgi:type I site-specific deoxyribonuclease, HsdR family
MTYESEAMMENHLIRDMIGQGYSYVKLDNESALNNNFRKIINEFNKEELSGKNLSNKEFERLMVDVSNQTVFKSAKLLRDTDRQVTLIRDDDSKVYLSLFDSRNYNRNIFQITNQTTVQGEYKNRYDVSVLINGLPLVQIELKRRGIEISEAFNQIIRYSKHSYHGLYRFIQIFVICNGTNTKYFANNDDGLLFSQTFHWTDEKNVRINSVEEFVRVFLDKSWIVKMLSDYTVINDTEKRIMVMRPYQVYATEAILRSVDNKRSGYIWHTTGSGKTLTSFKASQLMSKKQEISKIIFLVDRTDLDIQTFDEFNKFESRSVDKTEDTKTLVKQMKDQNNKFIVTTMQKMTRAILTQKYANVMDTYHEKNVIFVIDECHRSQFGKMHVDIQRHFKNAIYFGFTGTPRFAQNKGPNERTTADIFGPCLHTYLITEAIADKNVLGFMIHYYNTIEGNYDNDDKVMVEGIDTMELLMDEERINKIVNNIIHDHSIYTKAKRYTAILTVANIPMLIKYYNEFQSNNHDLKIAAIFSWDDNEDMEDSNEHSRNAMDRIISNYNNLFDTKFSTESMDSYQRDVSKRVKSKQVDILIVVNMFLTGFDSKGLNTLYIDKYLKYHDLLQAFSRTNRVEHNEWKKYGMIVCYRNLKRRTDEALKLFSNDSQINKMIAKEYGEYKFDTIRAVIELRKIVPTPADVDQIFSEEEQANFVRLFKEVARGIMMLESFVEFDFINESSSLNIDEITFQDYKSKYLDIYQKKPKDKVSVLNDVDFIIELLQTDRITYDYIRNLIRNIDITSENARKKSIELINKELDHTDNIDLFKKIDLLRAFLKKVSAGTVDLYDLDSSYVKFEESERSREIDEFSNSINVDSDVIRKQIGEYEYTNLINIENVLDELNLGLLERAKKKKFIIDFIISNTEKYQ